jgi:hypothetical protein
MDTSSPYNWLKPKLPSARPEPDVVAAGTQLAIIIEKEPCTRSHHQTTLAIGLRLAEQEADLLDLCGFLDISYNTARRLLKFYRRHSLVDVWDGRSLTFVGNKHLKPVLRLAISLLSPPAKRGVFDREPRLRGYDWLVGVWKEEAPQRPPDPARVASPTEMRDFLQSYMPAVKALLEHINQEIEEKKQEAKRRRRWIKIELPLVIKILYHLQFQGQESTEGFVGVAKTKRHHILSELAMLKKMNIVVRGKNHKRQKLSEPRWLWSLKDEARLTLLVVYRHLPTPLRRRCMALSKKFKDKIEAIYEM